MANDSKHLETKAFDVLEPKYQAFVLKYCERFDLLESAKAAGAASRTARKTAKKWLEREDVIAAISETMRWQRGEAERGKSALIKRLMMQATVCLDDLAEWSHDERKVVLKPLHKIKPEYRGAAHFAQVTREGAISFSGNLQRDAIKLLSELMLWNKEGRDDLPPVTFDFSGLKRTDYESPDKSPD